MRRPSLRHIPPVQVGQLQPWRNCFIKSCFAGSTPNRSIIIGVEDHHPFNNTGTVAAAKAAPQVQLSTTTLAQFSDGVPTGSAVYYALYNAMITGLTVQACSTDGATLRVIVFSAQGVALW